MSRVRNFSEIAPNIEFPEFNFYELYYSTFEKSELGRIKKLLPPHEMAENFGLVRKSMRPKLGRRSFFTPEGKVALMFLNTHPGSQPRAGVAARLSRRQRPLSTNSCKTQNQKEKPPGQDKNRESGIIGILN